MVENFLPYQGEPLVFELEIEKNPTAYYIKRISAAYTHLVVCVTETDRRHSDIFDILRIGEDVVRIYECQNIVVRGAKRIPVVGQIMHYRIFPAISAERGVLLIDCNNEFSDVRGEHIEVFCSQSVTKIKKPVKANKVTVSMTTPGGRGIPAEFLYYTIDGSVRYPVRLDEGNCFSVFLPEDVSLQVRAFGNTNVTVHNNR